MSRTVELVVPIRHSQRGPQHVGVDVIHPVRCTVSEIDVSEAPLIMRWRGTRKRPPIEYRSHDGVLYAPAGAWRGRSARIEDLQPDPGSTDLMQWDEVLPRTREHIHDLHRIRDVDPRRVPVGWESALYLHPLAVPSESAVTKSHYPWTHLDLEDRFGVDRERIGLVHRRAAMARIIDGELWTPTLGPILRRSAKTCNKRGDLVMEYRHGFHGASDYDSRLPTTFAAGDEEVMRTIVGTHFNDGLTISGTSPELLAGFDRASLVAARGSEYAAIEMARAMGRLKLDDMPRAVAERFLDLLRALGPRGHGVPTLNTFVVRHPPATTHWDGVPVMPADDLMEPMRAILASDSYIFKDNPRIHDWRAAIEYARHAATMRDIPDLDDLVP